MAYCPRCSREQRCGCDKCHICSGELVERRAASSGEPGRTVADTGGEPRRGILSRESHVEGSVTYDQKMRPSRAGSDSPMERVLPALLLVLGSGILLIALFEAINNALNFPGVGAAPTVADGLKRTGYYLGNLLYSSSVRALIGFALVSTGLLLTPERPIADRELARKIRLVVGLVMGAIALLCALASLLLVLPIGTRSLLLKNLLPSLWAAICILLVMGAALLYGGYLLVLYTGSGGLTGFAKKRKPAPGAPGSFDQVSGGLAPGGGNADTDSRGTNNRLKEGLAGTSRGVVKSYPDKGVGSEGDME